MNILGEWGRREAPFIDVTLLCPSRNLKHTLRLLIDTGASRTTIVDTDAAAMGLDYERLDQLPDGAVGIGGAVTTYILSDVRLVFESDQGLHEERLEYVLVLKHTFRGRKAREQAERIKALPSLLGRDIINRFRFIADRQANLVLLTNER